MTAALALVAVLAQAPDRLDRVTTGALLASSNVSIVPVWITAACTQERTCTELNPIMRRMLGEGPIRASVTKAALSGVAHLGIWTIDAKTTKRKIAKLIAALVLLAFNTWDAINDIQVMRAIDRARGPR